MSESTGARHYVLFPDVKNAQSLYELMKTAGFISRLNWFSMIV